MRQLRLYIARDEDGDLNVFYTKPRIIRDYGGKLRHWVTPFYNSLPLSTHLYPELTFEKSPQVITNLEFMFNFPREEN